MIIIENFEYRNEDNELITVEKIELDYMHNSIKFGQAYNKFLHTADYEEYANKILPETILMPKELRDFKVFSNDFEALDELLGHVNELMLKKFEAQPKRKKSTLKMD